jgi:hypothetical protein
MRTTIICRSLGAALALSATGCTTSLNAIRMGSGDELPAAGAPYSLPFAQYTIGITRRLVACRDEKKKPAAIIEVTAEITRTDVPDPAHHYVIDLESLHGATKKSNLVVAYHENGNIKSVNAASEDRTAVVIGNVVRSLGTIIKAGAAAGAAADAEAEVCLTYAGDPPAGKVDIRKLVDETIPAQAGEMKKLERQVTRLTARLAGETRLAAVLGNTRKPDDRKRIVDIATELADADVALSNATAALKQSLAIVSVTDKAVWPPDGATFGPANLVDAIPVETLDEWVATDDEGLEVLQSESRVNVALESTVAQSAAHTCVPACPDIGVEGLKYRMPLPGRLHVFTHRAKDDKVQTVNQAPGPIAQLGRVYALPLKSVAFSSRKAKAEFNEAGVPVLLGVESDATAEGATAALSDTLTQAAEIRGSVVTSKLERVKAETELLKAQKELEAAQAAFLPPKLLEANQTSAALARDTALLEAELANLEARRALDEARQLGADGG